MFPENRNEMMSPMQLEMLAREGMELNNDVCVSFNLFGKNNADHLPSLMSFRYYRPH